MAIGAPLTAARGFSHPENEQAHVRARALASQIGASPELPRVFAGMADVYLVKGDLAISAEVAQEALAAADSTGDALHLLHRLRRVLTVVATRGYLDHHEGRRRKGAQESAQ